jgi:nitrogen fixation protein NifU and related proteins
MTALYGEVIAEHWKHPHNRGALEAPEVSQEELNPLCGDRIRLELKITGGKIVAARFAGDACMVATASTSLLTDLLTGLSVAEAAGLTQARLLAELKVELRPARVACASLPLQALKTGLDRFARGAP